MKIVMVGVSLKTSFSKVGTKPKSAADSASINVPVFVNSLALKKGEELFYYQERTPSTSKGTKRPFDTV